MTIKNTAGNFSSFPMADLSYETSKDLLNLQPPGPPLDKSDLYLSRADSDTVAQLKVTELNR